MSRRAILQIGTEKTGTTTLQHFLAANRGRLRANGFVYPGVLRATRTTPGWPPMPWRPRKRDAIRAPFGDRSEADVAPMRARLRAAAAPRSSPAGGDRDLLLRALPQPADDRRRRWRRCATSSAVLHRRAGQRLPAAPGPGGAQPLLDPAEERRHRPGDPAADRRRRSLLQLRPLRWRSGRRASGAENVHVRLFDRAELVGRQTSSATSSRPGSSPGPSAYVAGRRTRTSRFDAAGPGVPAAGEPAARADRRPADRRGARAAGRPAGAAASRAGAHGRRAARPRRSTPCSAPSNEAAAPAPLSRTARGSSTRTSRHYPETRRPRGLRRSATSRASRRCCTTAATREVRRLEAEIAIRDARLHWLRDEPEAAERAMRPRARLVARTTPRPTARSPRTCCARAGSTRRSPPRRAPPSTGRTSHEYWHFLGYPSSPHRRLRRRRRGAAAGAGARARPRRRAAELDTDATPGSRGPQSAAFPLPANEAEACQRPRSA